MAQLPALGFNPRNALLDFSPINDAIDSNRKNALMQRESARQDDQIAMQKDNQQYQRGRDAQADNLAKIKRGGEVALAIQNMRDDDPAKQAAWGRYLKTFGDGDHSPEELDFRTGPKLASAAAGKFLDPRESQLMDLKIAGARADVAGKPLENEYRRAQIDDLRRKSDDPIATMLAERMRAMQKPAQPTPQQPLLQKQSFDGSGPVPGVQLVADGQTPQPAAPEPDTNQIDTPFGTMSREEARTLAGPMLLSPKYSTAGKALLEATQSGKTEGLAKPTVNQLEERTMNAAGSLARLSDTEKQFNPKFLELPTRVKMLGASWSAKAGASIGGKLSPELMGELRDYARFRASAANNLNTTLKELSGAAVTPQEAERLLADIPNAGSGVFDGDDPVSFDAKQRRAIEGQKAAIARYNFMRSKGLQFDKNSIDQFMSLTDVPNAVRQRGAEIERQMKQSNPNADPMSIQQGVKARLKQEFGI